MGPARDPYHSLSYGKAVAISNLGFPASAPIPVYPNAYVRVDLWHATTILHISIRNKTKYPYYSSLLF